MYGSGNHGFVIRDAQENGVGDEQTINSRHKVTDVPPELVLVFDDSTPETSILGAPPATVAVTAATFAFSADGGGASFECSLDSAAFTPCTSPTTYTGLSRGSPHVRGTREAARSRGRPDTGSARVDGRDSAGHDARRARPPRARSNDATLSFDADDAAATFECSLDAAAFASCGSPVELTGLADGEHDVPRAGHRSARKRGDGAGAAQRGRSRIRRRRRSTRRLPS